MDLLRGRPDMKALADVVYDACSHPNGWKPCWIFALGIGPFRAPCDARHPIRVVHMEPFPETGTPPEVPFPEIWKKKALCRFLEMGLTTPEVAFISIRGPRMLFRYSHSMRQRVLEVIDRASSFHGGMGVE
jgi:hypothetical protein